MKSKITQRIEQQKRLLKYNEELIAKNDTSVIGFSPELLEKLADLNKRIQKTISDLEKLK
jgi:hypothetical protein